MFKMSEIDSEGDEDADRRGGWWETRLSQVIFQF